jgi:hypothetical protein
MKGNKGMNVFEYVVVWHPTDKQLENGDKSKIVVDVDTILAKDERAAGLAAARALSAEFDDQLDQIEVKVRPF